MLKIGEFSKLSHLTVKALRFYDKEGLLVPSSVDKWNGYRLYDTAQLVDAANIKAYRQLDLSIGEIKAIFAGADAEAILREKASALAMERTEIDVRLSIINTILEDRKMKYQVTKKVIPEMTVYTAETTLGNVGDIMSWIPSVGAECMALNPDLKCADVPYEFIEYLDGEYRTENVRVRHSEAVSTVGKENGHIKFRTLPEATVLSVYHRGGYDNIGEAYAFIMSYAEQNGYKAAGLARESYIDGIWNKDNVADWLTEIQLPITDSSPKG